MRFPSSRRVDNGDSGGGGVGEVMLLTGDERKRATSISGGFNPSPIISTSTDTDVADSIRSEYGVNAFSNYDDYAKQSVTPVSSPYDSYSSGGGSGYGTVYSVGGTGGILTGNNNGGALFTGAGPSGASEFASKERMPIG